MPERVEIVCEVMRARVQWRSSFDGGDPQSFTVIVLNGQQRESRSDNISDKGENVIHSTFVQNLQPSTTYVIYVTAQNRHGLSSSEKVSCTTLEGKWASLRSINYTLIKDPSLDFFIIKVKWDKYK